MRGTLHICAAQDYHLLRLAFHNPSWWLRYREHKLGISQDRYQRIIDAALAHLGDSTATKDELEQLWREEGLISASDPDRLVKALLWCLDGDGVLAQSRPHGQLARYLDVTALPQPQLTKEDALAHLAQRYAYSRGPVTAADFARWTSRSLGQAKRALHQALQGQEQLPLQAAAIEGKYLVLLPADAPITAQTLLFRSDLPDLLEKHRDEAKRLMALPRFDELHNGYHDRQWLCDEEGEYLICPSRNGTNRPFMMYRGRLLGALSPQGLVYIGKPSARLQKQAERLMAALS